MKELNFNSKDFYKELNNHLAKRNDESNFKIDSIVAKIISNVKKDGDKALTKYAEELDNIKVTSEDIILKKIDKSHFSKEINNDIFKSFKKAIYNVSSFHKKQIPQNYQHTNDGVRLCSNWQPIDSVGLYIPGGKAVYPSSLIMNIVPAKVAGVKRIVCVTPPSNKINPYILAILYELEVNEIYLVGGAQAIAALAYGTESIKPVNKIFGPGNAYVSSAKKQVFGKVGIDLIAGPSEIIVVANKDNNPSWVASDLIAQAEHDVNSQSILISDSKEFVNDVLNQIDKLSADLSKIEIVKKSLLNNGLIVTIDDLTQSYEVINYIAPEHLHLHIKNNQDILKKVVNVGGIFLGEYSSEAFGDYIVGTNHILPTFGSAKFSSGLGVLDFMKRNFVVEMNKSNFELLSGDVKGMAEVEGLDAHKLSVKIRQIKEN